MRWHGKLATKLRKMKFFPCKLEPDILMRRKNKACKYIAVYVDDLAITGKNPKEITDALEKEYEFKLQLL